jgi:hypothetical protein
MDDFPWSVDTTGVVTIGGASTGGVIETAGDEDLFKVALNAGSTYVFELNSAGLADPYLYLYAPDATLLDSDDDGAGGTNSRITYTAVQSGVYYLGASDFFSGTGRYALIAQVATDDYAWSTATTGEVSVAHAGTAGNIDFSGDLDLLAVDLVQGRTYVFTLESTGLTDPYLMLYDDGLEQVAAIDDIGTSHDAGLVFTAHYSGKYFLGAADFGSGSGGYVVSGFIAGSDDYGYLASSAQMLSTGGTATTGAIDYATDGDLFKIAVQAGHTYLIELGASGGAKGFLRVYDANMTLVVAADGGALSSDARTAIVVSSSGTYYVGVSDVSLGTGSYSVSAKDVTPNIGTSGNNVLVGSSSNDVIMGMAGNDILEGEAGNDYLDGGAGLDTAVYTGPRAAYTISAGSFGTVVNQSLSVAEGVDSLIAVERLQFSDRAVALDLSGNAGFVAKILGAVFGSAFVHRADYVGTGIDLLDAGIAYEAAVVFALDARLGTGASSEAVVNLLYTNVMGAAPDAVTLANYAHLLESGAYSLGQLGILAAESVSNAWNIGLAGLTVTGLEYL